MFKNRQNDFFQQNLFHHPEYQLKTVLPNIIHAKVFISKTLPLSKIISNFRQPLVGFRFDSTFLRPSYFETEGALKFFYGFFRQFASNTIFIQRRRPVIIIMRRPKLSIMWRLPVPQRHGMNI